MHSYLDVIKKYATFSGRASRREFWMFYLFNIIFSIIFIAIVPSILNDIVGSVIAMLYLLAILLPSWAVLVRRLHDVGHSGWYYFIQLIPIIGSIMYLVALCSDGTPGSNQYGANPKETVPSANNSGGGFIQNITVMGREFEVVSKQPRDKNRIDNTESNGNEIKTTRG